MTEPLPMTAASPCAHAPVTLSAEGQALLLLAFVLVQSGKHRQALDVLEGLRHWEAQSTACLPLLTQCYLELGLFAEALPLAQELAREWAPERGQEQVDPQHGPALCATRMVAQALWGLNRKEEARAALEHILQTGTAPIGAIPSTGAEEDHALADA